MSSAHGRVFEVDEAIAVVVGLILGLAISFLLLRQGAQSEARGQFSAWRSTERDRIRQAALHRARGDLKEKVGLKLAEALQHFPFAPSDTRFIGAPVTYVVFDGYGEVQGRADDSLRSIVFVEMALPSETSRESALIRDCIERRRIDWKTLTLGDA